MSADIVELFVGWESIFDKELLELFYYSLYEINLPSGATVEVCRGKYGNIPVEVVKGGDLKDRVFIRGYGVSKNNKTVNKAKLRARINVWLKSQGR